jgi:VCBS repeat-containing protein
VTITWKRTANALLVALLAVLICGRLAGTARADVFDVSTPQDLQSAISAAAGTVGDDTINLAAGTYDIGSTIGAVNLRAFDASDGSSNGITLVGAGPSQTILDGDNAFGRVVNVTGSASMAIRGLTIRGSADDGLDATQGNPVALSDDVVRGNGGFGISGANLQITDATISGNGTTGLDVECGITATNVTVANNAGVGVHIDCANPGDALTNLTVAGNGDGGISFTDSLELDNSIVAGNAVGDCVVSRAPTGSNDLIGSGACGSSLTGVVTGDPVLGPVQDNGGPTPTMALGAGSPAIDAGNDSLCPATDQRGVSRPQGAHCDIGAFELAVAPNTAPTCSAYQGSVAAGGTLNDSVACTDPDPGDSFTVAVVSGPAHGTMTLHPDGSFSYSPAGGFAGTDSFTFQATDSHGAKSAVTTATIQVPNRAPTCSAYQGSVAAGGTLNDSVACSDPDPGDSFTVAVVAGPAHGTMTLHADGSFSYMPAAGFSGTDSFTFQATDSHGAKSAVTTATINVTNTPVGANVTVTPAAGLTLTFAAVSTAGVTSATSSLTGPPADGFQVPTGSLYWEITTTASYTAPIHVCLPVPPGVSNPRLIHFVNGQPVDVTTGVANGDVCGDVNSLSPFVVAVPAAAASALAYTGPTSVAFGPVTLSARLTDPSTHAGLGGRAVVFTVDAAAPIAHTTAADGSVSVTTALPLAPGVHTVTVSFAGDAADPASQTKATLTVTSSAHGSVTAIVPRLTSGGVLELIAHVGKAGKLIGELVYDGPHGLHVATTITALGIGADGHSAWIAGKDAAGHTFLANAVDAGGHGDKVRLWLDGTLVDGDGSLRLGSVHVDASQ